MKNIDLENMIKIKEGKITLKELNKEIVHYMFHKQPTNLIVTIERKEGIGYYSTIYIPTRAFESKYDKIKQKMGKFLQI